MKKRVIFLLVCLTLLLAVPAFAHSNNAVAESKQTSENNMYMDGTRDGYGNNYRAYANDRTGFNWGWLGLLGLFGLAGMRGRDRNKA
ncbi:WGxxGxxG family protein [Paenibacillus sp. GCM10027626]|uniref:WGxxGxxG family protein n=1 Tax=Paenibacillus sp. GCM10027626 TaxID=3273411 RepID=UPI00363EA702